MDAVPVDSSTAEKDCRKVHICMNCMGKAEIVESLCKGLSSFVIENMRDGWIVQYYNIKDLSRLIVGNIIPVIHCI
jgi:hypothetical protein